MKIETAAGIENAGGVSVYISKDIVEALKAKQNDTVEALAKAGLDPLCYDYKPTIGWMVRLELRNFLGLRAGGAE
ncbi:hypothetical protein ODD70_003287 [Salmonella enterica]|nr:hypothetical protein [Salmonella enterica]EKS4648861.1 hypothetical protein [Salmonella enterica]